MTEKRRGTKKEKKAPPKLVPRKERHQRSMARHIELVQELEESAETVLKHSRSLFNIHLRETKGHAKIKIDLKFPEFKKHLKDWLAKKIKEKPQESGMYQKAYNIVWGRFNEKSGLYNIVSARIQELGQQERQGVTQSVQELATEHPGAYKRYTQQRSEKACEICYKEGRKKFKGNCDKCREEGNKPGFAVMSFTVYYPKWRRLRREKKNGEKRIQ